jgi:hypothetical protein
MRPRLTRYPLPYQSDADCGLFLYAGFTLASRFERELLTLLTLSVSDVVNSPQIFSKRFYDATLKRMSDWSASSGHLDMGGAQDQLPCVYLPTFVF